MSFTLPGFQTFEKPHELYCHRDNKSECEGPVTFVQTDKNKQTASALKKRNATSKECHFAREFWRTVLKQPVSKHQKKIAGKALGRVNRMMRKSIKVLSKYKTTAAYSLESILQDKFGKLVKDYRNEIKLTRGRGLPYQRYVNAAYAQLIVFTEEHPEFKEKLPKKYIVLDDGTDGMRSAFDRVKKKLSEKHIVLNNGSDGMASAFALVANKMLQEDKKCGIL